MVLNTRPIGLVFKHHPWGPADVNAYKNLFDLYIDIISGNDPCLGARTGPNLEYEWITYQEVNIPLTITIEVARPHPLQFQGYDY